MKESRARVMEYDRERALAGYRERSGEDFKDDVLTTSWQPS